MTGAQIPDYIPAHGGGSSGRQSAADPKLAAEGRATPVDDLAPYGGDTKGTYDNQIGYDKTGTDERVAGDHQRAGDFGQGNPADRVTRSRDRGPASPASRKGADGTYDTPRLPTTHDTY